MPTVIDNENVKKMIVGSNEALYARKSEEVVWRRDRVVMFKTNIENSIESVTFQYNTNSDHVSTDTNYNNGSIDGNTWTDSQIMSFDTDSTRKCAFYVYGNTNIRVTITLKEGYYYDRSSLDSEYFNESMCSDQVYITTASGVSTQFRTVEFILKINKSIDTDIVVEFDAIKYTSVQISFPNFSGLYLNGTITSNNDSNILKSYNYQFIDEDRVNTLISLNFDQPVKVNLDIYSSLKGINPNLDTAIDNTYLGTEQAGGGTEYTELFGYIFNYGFNESDGVNVSDNGITYAEVSGSGAYFISNGYKAVHISSNTDEWVRIHAIIGSSNLYVCKLENQLTWCSNDYYYRRCGYEISDGTKSALIAQTNGQTNYITNIYTTNKLDGLGANYLRVRVNDYDDSSMPNVTAGNVTTDVYNYTNTINGTSYTVDDDKYLNEYTEDGASKMEMYLATFEEYKSCSISIERKTYTINFILDKNGYNVDENYYYWSDNSITVESKDLITFDSPNVNEFSSYIETKYVSSQYAYVLESKDVSCSYIKISKWYDTSSYRTSVDFHILKFDGTNSSLYQGVRSSDFNDGDLISSNGSITITTSDYYQGPIVVLANTCDKIDQIRVSKVSNDVNFPTVKSETRFGLTFSNTISSRNSAVLHLPEFGRYTELYFWVKSVSVTFQSGRKSWLYYPKGFFYANNLLVETNPDYGKLPRSGDGYVYGNNLPMKIKRNGNMELWFLGKHSCSNSGQYDITIRPYKIDSAYNPIDFYVDLSLFSYESFEEYGDRFNKISLNYDSFETNCLDMEPLKESTSLYFGNIYWAYGYNSSESAFTQKYITKSGSTSGRIPYYVVSYDPYNESRSISYAGNNSYNTKYYPMVKKWNDPQSLEAQIGELESGKAFLGFTISLCVALLKDLDSQYPTYKPGYGQDGYYTTLVMGASYEKGYFSKYYMGSNFTNTNPNYNDVYIFPLSNNYSSSDSNLRKFLVFGSGSSTPQVQQDNTLLYDFSPYLDLEVDE